MEIVEKLLKREGKISVIGLGYVGLPLAAAFSEKLDVIGFDINTQKIERYKQGFDPTGELGDDNIKNVAVEFTSDESKLDEAITFIVAVPTPINQDETPDLTPVVKASEYVGRHISRGALIVYESTVYPGVTEDVCVPILERESGLRCGVDFKVGYSPERINPADKVRRLKNIVKIVSGMDADTLDEVARLYEMIIEAGVYRAGTIKVAEAAKVAENSQRDINIAFMNELAMVFDRMKIDTTDVINAMRTKWNFLPFYPGLVGGHCIGVDPYYFIYEAKKLGYHSALVSLGRQINNGMVDFICKKTVEQMISANKLVKEANVCIFGLTFKENCTDIRNSKVIEIIQMLNLYEIFPKVVDPFVDKNEAADVYGITLYDIEDITDMDCVIFAVSHDCFKQISGEQLEKFFKASQGDYKNVIIDVKGTLQKQIIDKKGYIYWRL